MKYLWNAANFIFFIGSCFYLGFGFIFGMHKFKVTTSSKQ